MLFVLDAPTQTLLNEINDLGLTQAQVAQTYAMALRNQKNVDWPTINHAIIERWSSYGLEQVKKAAWKICEGR